MAALNLMLPAIRTGFEQAPLEFAAGCLRRWARLAFLLDRYTREPVCPSGAERDALAAVLGDELPRSAASLGILARAVEGTLLVGDPRARSVGRVRGELRHLPEAAAALRTALTTERGAAARRLAASEAASFARHLSSTGAVLEALVLPLAQ
jgi:hypothetical protein